METNEPIQFPEDPVKLPDQLEDRIVFALKKRRLIKSNKPLHSFDVVRIAAVLLLIPTLFIAGWISGSQAPLHTQEKSTKSSIKEYLLLLYDPPGFIQNEDQVKEYGAWMNNMSNRGIIGSGADLASSGMTCYLSDNRVRSINKPVSSNYGNINGFFIIQASTDAEAKAIAASCPHLDYKGVIEIRPLQ